MTITWARTWWALGRIPGSASFGATVRGSPSMGSPSKGVTTTRWGSLDGAHGLDRTTGFTPWGSRVRGTGGFCGARQLKRAVKGSRCLNALPLGVAHGVCGWGTGGACVWVRRATWVVVSACVCGGGGFWAWSCGWVAQGMGGRLETRAVMFLGRSRPGHMGEPGHLGGLQRLWVVD